MICKGLLRENCVPPCSYVNGEKRKYCRSRKVSAPKGECKGLAQENCFPPCSYVNKTRKYCKKSTKGIKRSKKKAEEARKIGNFMMRKRDKNTSLFLKTVCSDSGVCIAFGKETEKIKKFFDNFVFNYKKSQRRISEGANGVIYEIKYEKLDYKAYTIIKIAKKKADNLIYEYLVGMLFINTCYKKFPCFLETYNWCVNPTTSRPTFSTSVDIKKIINTSCKNPTDIGIQLEYLKNAVTIKSMLNDVDFWKNDILPVLFQIYFPLCCLDDTFTHYDLHTNNVLLFTPMKDSYIQYHYHAEKVISFKTRYISKIIDYGRSFFKTPTVSSVNIRDEVCRDASCNVTTLCGKDLGYRFLMDPHMVLPPDSNYINSSISNKSHDLRLLFLISYYYKNIARELNSLYSTFTGRTKVNITDIFLKKIVFGKNRYGTKEMNGSEFPVSTINIHDALLFLTRICSTDGFIKNNDDFYDPFKKIGDLHIYADGRNMEFIPSHESASTPPLPPSPGSALTPP